jgi:hypothetical protein
MTGYHDSVIAAALKEAQIWKRNTAIKPLPAWPFQGTALPHEGKERHAAYGGAAGKDVKDEGIDLDAHLPVAFGLIALAVEKVLRATGIHVIASQTMFFSPLQ